MPSKTKAGDKAEERAEPNDVGIVILDDPQKTNDGTSGANTWTGNGTSGINDGASGINDGASGTTLPTVEVTKLSVKIIDIFYT